MNNHNQEDTDLQSFGLALVRPKSVHRSKVDTDTRDTRPIHVTQVLKLLEDMESFECPPGCLCQSCEVRM
jgi:hypothetical protein